MPGYGTVVDITAHTAPHPFALGMRTIVIETDGEDRWIDGLKTSNPYEPDAEEISARVDAAGIVGRGGDAFPSTVKFNLGLKYPITTLIINGGECAPYLPAMIA